MRVIPVGRCRRSQRDDVTALTRPKHAMLPGRRALTSNRPDQETTTMTTRYGLLLAFLAPVAAQAQTAADSTAIRATALDYVEGWYEGNPERMTRALHPELVKR